jgi:hypothetical protein
VLIFVFFLVFRVMGIFWVTNSYGCFDAMGTLHHPHMENAISFFTLMRWMTFGLAGYWAILCWETWPKIRARFLVTGTIRAFELATILMFGLIIVKWSTFTDLDPPDVVVFTRPPVLSEKASKILYQQAEWPPNPSEVAKTTACVWLDEGLITDTWPGYKARNDAIEAWADGLDAHPDADPPLIILNQQGPLLHRTRLPGIFERIPAPPAKQNVRPATEEELAQARDQLAHPMRYWE